MNHNILLGGSFMRSHIIFPCRNRLINEFELILSACFLLIHLNSEIVHLPGYVRECFFLLKRIRHSIYRNTEKHFSCFHSLWHHNGAEFIVFAEWDSPCFSNFARSGDITRGEVNHRITLGVQNQYLFLQFRPSAFGESLAFFQGNAGITHLMPQWQPDDSIRRCYVRCLSPKEVTRFVTSHFIPIISRLIFLYFKCICVYIRRRGIWIIAVDVDMGVVILPIDIVGRIPFIGGLVESMRNVRSPIAVGCQCSWCVAIIVYNIYPHNVTITETIVIDTGHCHLVYFPRQGYDARVLSLRNAFQRLVVVTRREHQCRSDTECHIIMPSPSHMHILFM